MYAVHEGVRQSNTSLMKGRYYYDGGKKKGGKISVTLRHNRRVGTHSFNLRVISFTKENRDFFLYAPRGREKGGFMWAVSYDR